MKPPKTISQKAQLIKGIGASSWFVITKEKNRYRIKRFSLKGGIRVFAAFFSGAKYI